MPELDILFLNLHRRYLNFEADFGGFLGIYYLSAYLRKNLYAAKGFSGTLNQGKKILDNFCAENKISMLGLYCDYDNVTENIFISRYVKENFNLPVIVGGPQATALEENFFVQSKCDAVVIGEGELTVLELTKFFIDGVGDLKNILGINFLTAECLQKNPARPLIKNLDDLPFIDEYCYLEPQNFYRGLNIMTGRGCPFHCAFGHEGTHSKTVRFRSVENVLAEIDAYLKNWHSEELYILFADDTFTLNFERLKKICDGIKERRKHFDIKFFCEGHVHTLYKNPEMISCLAEAGCVRLQLGIEAGTEKVLKAYGKNSTPQEIFEVVRLCRDSGINEIYGNIILGGAFFSREVFEADKKFVRDLIFEGQGAVEIGIVTFWTLPETKMTTFPADFGIKICDKNFLTSCGDFPQTETDKLDRLTIAEMQVEFQNLISAQMTSMLKNRQVPTERILSWFPKNKQTKNYGLWFLELQKHEILFAYYEMLNLGEGFESKDIKNLSAVHPLRVVELYKHLTKIDKNSALICGEKFVGKELEIVTLTTGKLSVAEIAEKVCIPISEVMKVLDRLEKIFLIVYAEY